MHQQHKPKSRQVIPFQGCVQPRYCRPQAHGPTTTVATCSCGAVRYDNLNPPFKETGTWNEFSDKGEYPVTMNIKIILHVPGDLPAKYHVPTNLYLPSSTARILLATLRQALATGDASPLEGRKTDSREGEETPDQPA